MTYIPYHVHSHFSIRKAFAHIDDLVEKAFELKLPAIALTDIESISGCAEFIREIEKRNKKSDHKVKPILGADLYFPRDEQYVTVLCKNLQGWKNLIHILGSEECKLEDYSKNLILIIHDVMDETALKDYINMFDHVFISIENHRSEEHIKSLTELAVKHDLHILIGNEVFYVNEEDNLYQQIIVCSNLKCRIKDIHILEREPEYERFFKNNEAYLYNEGDTSTLQLLDLIEEFSIAQNPSLPDYKDEQGNYVEDCNELLTQLCRDGWKTKLTHIGNNAELKEVYSSRIQEELKTILGANLSTYFLIIRDIMSFGTRNGQTVGLRGSAAGCLISYLIGISPIDPILPDPSLEYHPDRCLKFERFYNRARNTEGNISLPDIDCDIPISFRKPLIKYIEDKYGKECVGHIITFQRLDGRGALKEVFRILDSVPFSAQVANDITKEMIDTAKVSDVLEDLREDDPKYNIINYCIDNIASISDFYKEYTREFDLAIKLASTISGQGKHAAGIVIASEALENLFPTSYDPKTGKRIVAMEMMDAEYVGAVKYDILGVAAMEKIDKISDMIKLGLKEPNVGYTDIETD